MNRRPSTPRSILATISLFAIGLCSPVVEAAGKNVCTLTCSQPVTCLLPSAVRRDIAPGQQGLPALLSFQLVDADSCTPIAGASVEVWHFDPSGDPSCPSSPRGTQVSDKDGWVNFNTVFPGWISGRTPHVNVVVRMNGQEAVTTQFYFEDELIDLIYSRFAPYSSRGPRDTTNRTDPVLGASLARVTPYLLNAKIVLDKALVATKVIGVRSSPGCQA